MFLSSLDFPEAFFRGISFIGAGILIWIATFIWKIKKIDTGNKLDFSFWKISIMILANSILWIFWITICIPKAIFLGDKMFLGDYAFLASVEIGWFITTSLVAFLFSRFRTILSKPRIIPIVFKIFALTFVYFAIDMIYQSVLFFVTYFN